MFINLYLNVRDDHFLKVIFHQVFNLKVSDWCFIPSGGHHHGNAGAVM